MTAIKREERGEELAFKKGTSNRDQLVSPKSPLDLANATRDAPSVTDSPTSPFPAGKGKGKGKGLALALEGPLLPLKGKGKGKGFELFDPLIFGKGKGKGKGKGEVPFFEPPFFGKGGKSMGKGLKGFAPGLIPPSMFGKGMPMPFGKGKGKGKGIDISDIAAYSSKTNKFTLRFIVPEEIAADETFKAPSYLIGPGGRHMKQIYEVTGSKLRVRGKGSGHKEGPENEEAQEPLQFCISADSEWQLMQTQDLAVPLFERMIHEYCRTHNRKRSDFRIEVVPQDAPREQAFFL